MTKKKIKKKEKLKVEDEYYDSPEFRKKLAEYEDAMESGKPVFMDGDELAEIADFYQLENRLDAAEEAIRLALERNPGGIEPLTYRFHEALEQGDTAKAWSFLRQVTETNEPDYVYDKGEIMVAEGRTEEAHTFFLEELKLVPPDEQQDYIVDVAKIFSDYDQNEKAMDWISRAKEEKGADFKELKARTLLGQGRYEDSVRVFNELLDMDPFQKRYWTDLASAQFMDRDYEGAIESCEYAIAIDPQDANALAYKAYILYRMSNYEESEKYHRRYLEQRPYDEHGHLILGNCLTNLGRQDEALEELLKGIEVAHDGSPYLIDLYQELAFVHARKGEIDEALDYLDKGEAAGCDRAQLLLARGHVLLSVDRKEEADIYFRQSMRLSKDPVRTLLRVTASLYDNQYLEACYRLLKKFFNTEGVNHADGYACMALCCHDLHKDNEYLDYLKRACETDEGESRMILGHLFPEGMAPSDYYEYAKKEIEKN